MQFNAVMLGQTSGVCNFDLSPDTREIAALWGHGMPETADSR